MAIFLRRSWMFKMHALFQLGFWILLCQIIQNHEGSAVEEGCIHGKFI